MIIAIDLSLRSTGLTCISRAGELLDFKIVTTKKEDYEDEMLLLYNTWNICGFISKFELTADEKIDGIAIEGLSFGGIGGKKDLLQGNFWVLLVHLKKHFFDIPVGKIPVLSWRAKVLSKEEQREAKKPKNGLKQAVIDKLPADVRSRFEEYLVENKLPKKCLEDLADSYFLGQYRLSLG